MDYLNRNHLSLMPIKKQISQGFTLIELLVVITIIAILAGIALPVFSSVQVKAAQTKALAAAKQLGLACKLYAGDFNGNYPYSTLNRDSGREGTNPPNSSNDSLGNLYPDYVPDKKSFWLAQDKAYCAPNPPTSTTNNPALAAGENHWAYFPGLSETSTSNWPLIADPTTANGATTYSTDENAAGGTWKAKKAIVVYVDGSGAIEVVNSTTRSIPGPNTDITNLFQTGNGWLSERNAIKCPLPNS